MEHNLEQTILKETWARRFLLTLFYALWHPTSPQNLQHTLTAALIITSIIYGLIHFPFSLSNPMFAVFIAFIYGIPLGVIHIKRDYVSAIAYNFFFDLCATLLL